MNKLIHNNLECVPYGCAVRCVLPMCVILVNIYNANMHTQHMFTKYQEHLV